MNIAFWLSFVLLWGIIVVQTVVLLEVLRQIGILRKRIGDEPAGLLVEGEGLDRGSPAPSLVSAQTIQSALPANGTEKGSSLLVFLTTRCESCRRLFPAINQFAANEANVNCIVVCSNPNPYPDECSAFVNELGPEITLLFDPGQHLFRQYGVKRTPSATLVINNIVHIHAVVNNLTHLEALLDEEVSITNSPWVIAESVEETRPQEPSTLGKDAIQ